MGLMDEFKTERHGPPLKCPVHKLVQLLGDKDGADLEQAVNENVIPASVIQRVLARRDVSVSSASITRHRRGECGCGK